MKFYQALTIGLLLFVGITISNKYERYKQSCQSEEPNILEDSGTSSSFYFDNSVSEPIDTPYFNSMRIDLNNSKVQYIDCSNLDDYDATIEKLGTMLINIHSIYSAGYKHPCYQFSDWQETITIVVRHIPNTQL